MAPFPVHFARTALSDVYRTTRSDGSQVAIKCLRKHDPKHLKRTARELNTWSKLNHKNILELCGLAEFDGCLSMVSRWMERGSVMSMIKKRPETKRIPLCQQLTAAVAYLHSENVVHGDIKGDNLLIDQDGTVKLTDFGLTIMYDQVLKFSSTDPGGGTFRWMAPELYEENPSRCFKTDIWAMGMTMLEIMTGDVPFREIKCVPSVSWAVVQGRRIPHVPELETELVPHEARIMVAVLEWCWAYEPSKRPTAQKVESVVGALAQE